MVHIIAGKQINGGCLIATFRKSFEGKEKINATTGLYYFNKGDILWTSHHAFGKRVG